MTPRSPLLGHFVQKQLTCAHDPHTRRFPSLKTAVCSDCGLSWEIPEGTLPEGIPSDAHDEIEIISDPDQADH